MHIYSRKIFRCFLKNILKFLQSLIDLPGLFKIWFTPSLLTWRHIGWLMWLNINQNCSKRQIEQVSRVLFFTKLHELGNSKNYGTSWRDACITRVHILDLSFGLVRFGRNGTWSIPLGSNRSGLKSGQTKNGSEPDLFDPDQIGLVWN